VLVAIFACAPVGWAQAEASRNPWGEVRMPTSGAPRAIGDYSRGCVSGARALPPDGNGYQVMHPGRLRYFGHPSLVGFVQDLGKAVAKARLGVLLVGDLSQPRGGRATGGHASHQSGLDVDVWFWHPKKAERVALSNTDRETLKARSILDGQRESIHEAWKTKVAGALERAASDARVERIFVHPWIKRELCADATPPPAWLRKIRPWYGHDDHFHVRLACPEGSAECTPQAPVPEGDGCHELDYWLSDEAKAEREKGRKQYISKVVGKPKWPPQCDAVLAAAAESAPGESAPAGPTPNVVVAKDAAPGESAPAVVVARDAAPAGPKP
jgi:penicillin-insensitive murein endopeptidase